MHYVIFKDARGLWRWVLYAGGQRKIAESSIGYVSKSECQSTISLVKGSGGAIIHELAPVAA
jgi:uncharacterized protein YegP (UPF0339 family)